MALALDQQRALFWEGYAARLDAMGKANCQYASDTEQYTYWLQGWDAAWTDVRESSLV